MYYFISDIHGAADAYFELKETVCFCEKDSLYIVGDILNGNNKNPKECLDILDDVIANDNIHLLLGNHEFAHINYYLHYIANNSAGMKFWWDYLVEPTCGGLPLLKHFRGLPKERYQYYMDYLMKECAPFFYGYIGNVPVFATHGSPVPLEKTQTATLSSLLSTRISFYKNTLCSYIEPLVRSLEPEKEYTFPKDNNYVVIVGHTPTKYYIKDDENLKDKFICAEPPEVPTQYVLLHNDILCLDCGCRANSLGKVNPYDGWKSNLALVGIDENGINITYHTA